MPPRRETFGTLLTKVSSVMCSKHKLAVVVVTLDHDISGAAMTKSDYKGVPLELVVSSETLEVELVDEGLLRHAK